MVSSPTGERYISNTLANMTLARPKRTRAHLREAKLTGTKLAWVDQWETDWVERIVIGKDFIKSIEKTTYDTDCEKKAAAFVTYAEHSLDDEGSCFNYLAEAISIRAMSVMRRLPESGDRRFYRLLEMTVINIIFEPFHGLAKLINTYMPHYFFSEQQILTKRETLRALRPHLAELEKLDAIQLEQIVFYPRVIPPNILAFIQTHLEAKNMITYLIVAVASDILQIRSSLRKICPT